MKLERELHPVLYWCVGVAVFVGALIPVLVIYVMLELEGVFESLYALLLLGAILIAAEGRYGKITATNFFIIMALPCVPLIGAMAFAYYLGRGSWMKATKQSPLMAGEVNPDDLHSS